AGPGEARLPVPARLPAAPPQAPTEQATRSVTMTTAARRGSAVTIPFEVLSESGGLPAYDLPAALATIYGGTLGFTAPCLYANFVSSVDGVVSLGHEHPSSGGVISGGSLADRFVMGLLRVCADAVLIGAGTLRGSPGHVWTPGHVYPPGADDFTEVRRHLGRSLDPVLFVVTASGDLDVTHPGLRAGSVILTGDAGAKRMRGRLPDGVVVRSLGDLSHLPIELVVDAV